MPNTIAAPRLHNIALNQDFGDSPTGKLGERAVQTAPAGPGRAGGAARATDVAQPLGLGGRAMNFVTPAGLRVESKVREGLRLTSAGVGDLLGALSKTRSHNVDGFAAKALLDALPHTALPLTSRGTEFAQVFGQRVLVHVQNMSTSQLLALQDGVALARNSPLNANPYHAQSLTQIEGTVAQELGKRMLSAANQGMQPILDKLIRTLAQEAQQPGSVGFVYDELGGAVDRSLQGHGHDPASAGYEGLKASVLKQFLSDALDSDTENVTAIVRHLPDKEMRKLMQVTQAVGEHPNAGIELCVSSAIGSRLERAQASFMQHAGTLMEHTAQSVVAHPKSFRDSVIAAADQLSQLQAQIKTHNLKFPAEVNDRVQQLLGKLAGLCEDPRSLPLDRAAIDNTTLQKFGQALDKFLATNGVRHIDAEISQRKADTQAPFRTAIQTTCQLATNLANVGGLLTSLTRFADEGKKAVLARQELDGRGMSSEDMVAFRSNLAKEALQGLDDAELGTMFATLNTPEMKSVYGSLVDMADVLLHDPETEAVSTRLSGACGQLDELGLLVRTVLEERGIQLPDLPDTDRYDLKTLSAQGHAAISQAFGVEAGQGDLVLVKVATAGPGFQQTFERNLRDMQASPESDPAEVLPDGRPTGVGHGFWKDLLRSNYNITAADGTTAPLIDRDGVAALPEVQRDAPMLASVVNLRALTGNNDPLLMVVSQFACQNSLAGLFGVIGSSDSPIRLPDGTHGAFVSGQENTTYNLESDGDGGVVMRIDYNRMGVRDMMTQDGNTQSLNPASSHFNASVELTFTRDLQMTVSDPLIYGYDAQPALSKSIADVADMPLSGLASLVFEIEAFQKTHGGPTDYNPDRFGRLQAAIEAEIAQQAPTARDFIATFMTRTPNGNDNTSNGLALALQMPPTSPVRTELRRQVTQEFTSENLDFLEALQEGRHRTLAGARALAADLVEESNDHPQVNIASRSRQSIVDALAAPHAHTLDAEQLDLIFKDARKEILRLVGTNSIQAMKSRMGI